MSTIKIILKEAFDVIEELAPKAAKAVAEKSGKLGTKTRQMRRQIDSTDRDLAGSQRTPDRAPEHDAPDPVAPNAAAPDRPDAPAGFAGHPTPLGPHYDEVLAAHNARPEWVAHPADWTITSGDELDDARRAYQNAVRSGDLSMGHHRQGLADGGRNVEDNIQFTGEARIRAAELDGLDLDFYREYGKGKTWLNIFQETPNSPFRFGANPNHTAVTNLQNLVHRWQRDVGLRP